VESDVGPPGDPSKHHRREPSGRQRSIR
jgi:hypothetical protein